MEVSCPCCRAHLVLPVQVVGQSVRCPKCHAVLLAESNRLIAPDQITARSPAPRPTGAVELPPLADDSALDLAIPPGHVFPAQRNAEILRNLSWVGLWMRIVAAADLLSVFAISALMHLAQQAANAAPGATVTSLLCGLAVVSPVSVLLWLAGGSLMQARLHGREQQAALVVGIAAGTISGLAVLIGFVNVLARRGTGGELAAIVVAGAVSLATFLVSAVAEIVRRQVGELAEPESVSETPSSDPASAHRRPQQLVRSAARSLRLATLALVLWYPLSCCCCASVRTEIRHGSLYWVVPLWAVGLLPLALMHGGAYYLEQQRRRGAVIAGIIAALVVSVGFGVDFVVSLANLARPHFGDDVPLLLAGAAVSFAVALASLIAGVNVLQAIADPEVRQAFARNR